MRTLLIDVLIVAMFVLVLSTILVGGAYLLLRAVL